MLRLTKLKKNSRGFSLVEMIAAFALLGVAMAAIGGFLIVGIRSYTKDHAESVVQNESQVALNQIESTVIDAGLGVNYNVCTGTGTYNFVMNDDDPKLDGLTIKDKILYVFNWKKNSAGEVDTSGVHVLLIRWDPVEERLYYADPAAIVERTRKVDGQDVVNTVSEALSILEIPEWDLFAEGVAGFSCDLSDYKNTGKITVSLSMKKKNQIYNTFGTITLRNDVLINSDDMDAIYSRVDQTLDTIIDSVVLTTSSNYIVKGGEVQLTTHVKEKQGYPSQAIARWTVDFVDYSPSGVNFDAGYVQYEEATRTPVFDTAKPELSSNTLAAVDPATKVLTLSKEANAKLLRVTCYISAKDPATGQPFSATRYVAVKNINFFTIQAVPNLELPANLTLIAPADGYPLASTKETPPDGGWGMDAYPGNEIQMKATVSGDYLVGADGIEEKIIWTIQDMPSVVKASISSSGMISIDKYSQQGTFAVMAYPQLDPSMKLFYYIHVGNTSAEGTYELMITGGDNLSRGTGIQLGLKMNNQTIATKDLADFDWTVKAYNEQGTITGTTAKISDGYLTISSDLSYDYDYFISVTASMKSNPDVNTMTVLKVPKVTIKMSPETYRGASRGVPIPEGEINCYVEGLKSYTLDWAIASTANPNQFGTILTNGSYISWNTSAVKNTASVYISGNEPKDLKGMWVRASIHGYSGTYATTYIAIQPIGIEISADKYTLKRGEESTARVSFTEGSSNTGIKKSNTKWQIVKAVYAGTKENVSTDGITMTNAVGESTTLKVASTYLYTGRDITVTLKASLQDIPSNEIDITIKGITLAPASGTEYDIMRGETKTLEVNGYPSDVKWDISSNNYLTSGFGKQEDSNKSTKVSVTVSLGYDTENHNDDVITLRMLSAADNTEIAKYYYKVKPVKFDAKEKAGSSYTYTASQEGFNEGDYEIVWGIGDKAWDVKNLDTSSWGSTSQGAVLENDPAGKKISWSGVTKDTEVYVYAALVADDTVWGIKSIGPVKYVHNISPKSQTEINALWKNKTPSYDDGSFYVDYVERWPSSSYYNYQIRFSKIDNTKAGGDGYIYYRCKVDKREYVLFSGYGYNATNGEVYIACYMKDPSNPVWYLIQSGGSKIISSTEKANSLFTNLKNYDGTAYSIFNSLVTLANVK